ncbi:MAG TPA: PilC/PilY family type IV pilus protein [Albitalea sp.]|uniref:pilus assembly protein n=1 Tax=Piscinibacter sp. TaxID=1903157 RepID=UPI002ED0EECB
MKRRQSFTRFLSGLCLLWLAGAAFAAPADISNVPVSQMTTASVRSNLMFILDDSGSMASDFLPDDAGGYSAELCFAYSGFNRVFYDPTTTYVAPVNGSNASMGDASFTGVYNDGFTKAGSTIDLSNRQNLNSGLVTTVATHNISTTVVSVLDPCGSRNSGACTPSKTATNTAVTTVGYETVTTITYTVKTRGNATGKTCSTTNNTCKLTTTTEVEETRTSKPYWVTLNAGATNDCTPANYTPVYTIPDAQKTNYANWYQYYRTRMLMMRSASGRVFANIDPLRFRVGFSTISYTGITEGSDFLNVNDFVTQNSDGTYNTTQRDNFFTKLYGQAPSGSTPLRPALEKAGKYFAKKATSSQTYEPMQYSCQRNFTLLSTDGYWNTAAEPASYKPQKLDGTGELGNLDGVLATSPRPKYDSTGAKNSLADIAKYFYDTDLRTTALNNCKNTTTNQDLCANGTPKADDKTPVFQNMTTYTLGLGVPGILNYQSNYDSAASGDYKDIVSGTKDWPDPLSSTNGGLANTGNTVTSRIDDLWHAAVNGGGRYYSAGNPNDLVIGLTDALQKIDAKDGAAAAAATSTLRPVINDNWVFIPSYQTQTWTGDVGAYKFAVDADGHISVTTASVWTAAKKLAAQSSRKIYFFDSAVTGNLNNFVHSNLSATQQGYFNNLCQSGSVKLAQCATLTTEALKKVTGPNVVDYLRGKNSYEMTQSNKDNQVFRTRQAKDKDGTFYWTPLGDVINASPAYVRVPPFRYTDSGYAEFRNNLENTVKRKGMLYVAANDGMLHALRADDGTEAWAYVPSQVMPNMFRLADADYTANHAFFVDGTPVVADVFDGSKWRTILIGGFGGGGRGYYALDVTDPEAPLGLWEFTDSNMGLSYGEPVVAKNKAGKWIAALSSGYNNTAGDGRGRVYLRDAITGAEVLTIDTKVGTSAAPSNLSKLNAWVEKETDNTALRLYGGDMQGNVWRFDFDHNYSTTEAVLLGQALNPSGSPQPITTQPILSAPTSTVAAVTVATGRYLGTSDLTDKSIQSVYSFKDTLGTTSLGDLRKASGMVQRTMDAAHAVTSGTTFDWVTQTGWFLDFDVQDAATKTATGERVNVDMDLQLDILTVATTLPTPTPCSPGGTSWLYFLDMASGNIVHSELSDTPIIGVVTLMEGSNTSKPQTITLASRSDRSVKRYERPKDPSGGTTGTTPRRTSWRELVN